MAGLWALFLLPANEPALCGPPAPAYNSPASTSPEAGQRFGGAEGAPLDRAAFWKDYSHRGPNAPPPVKNRGTNPAGLLRGRQCAVALHQREIWTRGTTRRRSQYASQRGK